MQQKTYELYAYIKIKRNGVIGQIIDSAEQACGTIYTVESNTQSERANADYPSLWPLYNCKANEIEPI